MAYIFGLDVPAVFSIKSFTEADISWVELTTKCNDLSTILSE